MLPSCLAVWDGDAMSGPSSDTDRLLEFLWSRAWIG